MLSQPAGSGIRSRTTALVSLCGVFAVALLTGCANTTTTNAGTGIPVGFQPSAIAITPDGTTAYVVSVGGNTEGPSVTPIDLATKTPGTPFKVGDHPAAIAITPNGTTAYLVNYNPNSPGFSPSPPPGPSSVTPIDLATRTPGPPILGPFGEGFQTAASLTIFCLEAASIQAVRAASAAALNPLPCIAASAAASRAGPRPPLQRTIDNAQSRKHAVPWVGFVDLATGVYGAILVNLLACLVLGLSWINDLGAPILIFEAVAAWILNIGALVISAVVRPRIMYAMLVADLIVWVIVLIVAFVVVAGTATLALPGF